MYVVMKVEIPRKTKMPITAVGTSHRLKLSFPVKPRSSSAFMSAANAGSVDAVISMPTMARPMRPRYGSIMPSRRFRFGGMLIDRVDRFAAADALADAATNALKHAV